MKAFFSHDSESQSVASSGDQGCSFSFKPVPLREVISEAVCEFYGLTWEELVSPGNHRRTTWPRQMAMALTYELTNMSQGDVGAMYGRRDHGTVIHAIKAVNQRSDLAGGCFGHDRSIKKMIEERRRA